MGIGLNTVGVNASIDDHGWIVRWFDKEAACPVLGGRWYEVAKESAEAVVWEPVRIESNSLKYRWSSGSRSASKHVSAGYRSIEVQIRGQADEMISVVELAAGDGTRPKRFDTGFRVSGPRAIVTGEWDGAGWSWEKTETGVRIEIPIREALCLRLSVADST